MCDFYLNFKQIVCFPSNSPSFNVYVSHVHWTCDLAWTVNNQSQQAGHSTIQVTSSCPGNYFIPFLAVFIFFLFCCVLCRRRYFYFIFSILSIKGKRGKCASLSYTAKYIVSSVIFEKPFFTISELPRRALCTVIIIIIWEGGGLD